LILIEDFFLFFEFMALRMTTFYGLQVTQVNEEPLRESSLDLTLTHHSRDENPELRKVHFCFEVEPLQVWYYCISPNFHTLVILLQVDPVFGDEPKTIYEGFYKIENTSIFAWSSIFGVGHYRWLCNPIHRLLLNNNPDYLIRTI
jgi:hypothetical protein